MTTKSWNPFDHRNFTLVGGVALDCDQKIQRSVVRRIAATPEYEELLYTEALVMHGPVTSDIARRLARARVAITEVVANIADAVLAEAAAREESR